MLRLLCKLAASDNRRYIEHVIGNIKRYRIIHDIIRFVVPNFGIWS